MSKNVAVFVDVANIFYAAKAAGVDIDYVTLLKASSAGRDLVRAYAYTGLDPDNENQRNFHDFLRRSGYKVVSKDIRKYGDGKVKANLDIELVVDMMKTARNLDVAIIVSGDGDFAPAIRAVQEMGVRVEVVSFRGNTSSDLMDVADLFTDIIQIAKVERGSSRSGRRVAGDDDLSMTEVPDKQSEGTGERTRGGRGRTRRTSTPVAAAPAARGRTRAPAMAAAEPGSAPQIVALPGEKLSRAAAAASPGAAAVDLEIEDDAEELEPLEAGTPGAAASDGEDMSEDGPRRRRRRGGRGRGRARGREDGELSGAPAGPAREAIRGSDPLDDDAAEAEDAEEMPAPARRAASAFGSVWDSQIGIPAARRSSATPSNPDEEDFDEPSVPEYLITERRQRDGNRGGARGGGGGRGRGGAYAAALDRERFGGGRGSRPSAFQQPAPAPRDGGFNRPERGDRNDRMDRGDRRPPFRAVPAPAPRGSGDEPWSEVPPEIEAMLRAQLGTRQAAPRRDQQPAPESGSSAIDAFAPAAEPVTSAAPSRRGRRPAADAASETVASTDEGQAASAEAAPKARRTAVRKPRGATAAATDGAADAAAPAAKPTRSTTTRRTTATRSKAAAADAESTPAAEGEGEAAPAPKRRAPRKKAETAETAG